MLVLCGKRHPMANAGPRPGEKSRRWTNGVRLPMGFRRPGSAGCSSLYRIPCRSSERGLSVEDVEPIT